MQMTDIEQKALALVNEEAGHDYIHARNMADKSYEIKALCRAIERHEAFRQEVSDAVEAYLKWSDECLLAKWDGFDRFIIPKPDPLVAVLHEVDTGPEWDSPEDYCNKIRAALEARGLEIVPCK